MLIQAGRFDSSGPRTLACLFEMTTARVGLVLVAASVLACSPVKRAEAPPAATSPVDPARPLPSPLPAVVARVNGRPITLEQILPLAKLALERMPASERDKDRPAALRQSLDLYVERELLLQEALARGISADRHEVDWAYDQARRGHPEEAEWTAYLATQGVTPQSFRSELRIQKTVAALLLKEILTAPIGADEVRAAYDADPLRFAPKGAQSALPFEEVRGEVEKSLRLAKQGPIAAALVARLRSKARIELLL